MTPIVTVSDIDGTITAEDSILAFFGRFGKRNRAEQLWKWSKEKPERAAQELGIPLNRVYPSMDIEVVFKEILEENGPVALDVFAEVAKGAALAKSAEAFIRTTQTWGEVVLLSAMFQPQAEAFAKRFGLPAQSAFATKLRRQGSCVTEFTGPVCEGQVKAETLETIREKTGVPLSRFVGIGDSASDAPFIKRIVQAGGLGLAVSKDAELKKAGALAVKSLDEAAGRIESFTRGKRT